MGVARGPHRPQLIEEYTIKSSGLSIVIYGICFFMNGVGYGALWVRGPPYPLPEPSKGSNKIKLLKQMPSCCVYDRAFFSVSIGIHPVDPSKLQGWGAASTRLFLQAVKGYYATTSVLRRLVGRVLGWLYDSRLQVGYRIREHSKLPNPKP